MMRLTDDGKDGAALLTRAASLTRMGLVRCLKGAASSVLWALLLEGRPMTAVQLQEATGYSDKPVSQALARLRALGLVVHHGRYQGWSLSGRIWTWPHEVPICGTLYEARSNKIFTTI
jgi:biotin operon repressor